MAPEIGRHTRIQKQLESSRDKNGNIILSPEEAKESLLNYLIHFFKTRTANRGLYLPKFEVEALLSIMNEESNEKKFNLTERIERLLEEVRKD